MKWKNMLQVGLLLILGAVVFYFVYPKWQYYPNSLIKINKITGQIYQWSKEQQRWILATNKPKRKLIDDLGILYK